MRLFPLWKLKIIEGFIRIMWLTFMSGIICLASLMASSKFWTSRT